MVSKRPKGSKKVKSLPAKALPAQRSKKIKGGGVDISPIVITKRIDKSSPKLYE